MQTSSCDSMSLSSGGQELAWLDKTVCIVDFVPPHCSNCQPHYALLGEDLECTAVAITTHKCQLNRESYSKQLSPHANSQ